MARASGVILALLIGLLGILVSSSVSALPLYSVSSSTYCDTCHIEPSGWFNPDISKRRCTLDCVGCHVSPAGGGLRTPDGQYYGKEVLPMYGDRPSSYADPERYRPDGHPKKGYYSLTEGFSGWWPGPYGHTTIKDRYGNINPRPKWNVGGDFRAMVLNQQVGEEDGETFFFPMQADVYGYNESVEDLQLYVALGVQGRKDTDTYEGTDLRDNFTVREVFAKYRMDYNSYVRFGRIIPRYGWRLDDHTAYIRQDLGFNQYYSAFGVDASFNPNYFYADASFYWQGNERWPGERLQRGLGTTFNVGFRDLGYQLGASFNYTDIITGNDQIAAGIQWAINLNPFVYYGELDLRRVILEGEDSFNGLVAYNEFNFNFARGVYGKFKYDWGDPNIQLKDDHKHRVQLGLDVHPYTFVDFEAGMRLNFSPRIDFTDIASRELYLIVHLWF